MIGYFKDSPRNPFVKKYQISYFEKYLDIKILFSNVNPEHEWVVNCWEFPIDRN